MQEVYRSLCQFVREYALIDSIRGSLAWDERTMMPAAAAAYRGEQMKALARMAHERRTDERVGEMLSQLEQSSLATDPTSETGATIRALRRDHERAKKLPASLVEALAEATVIGQQAWQQARENDSFSEFAPHLERILRLIVESAEAIGYVDHKYDPLLDEYEPGTTTRQISTLLAELAPELSQLVSAITDGQRPAPVEILKRNYDVDKQDRFGSHVAEQIGFDFQRGRLDVSVHPFCESVGPNDCRITTRYQRNCFGSAFFGILHEAGHGIYEQGLRREHFGLPLGQHLSLGMHESQSRMWENFVGRGLPFWTYFFPHLKQTFPKPLQDVSVDQFHWAINAVQPSLIRVEADEATYNLHIVVRFELERDLIGGELAVVDLPVAWREKYQRYLGVAPTSDADGVLQDIHWSSGLVGYFPTYALGNLYAAQLFAQAAADIGDIDEAMRRGEFEALTDWLRLNIHYHGRRYTTHELMERVTGKPVSSAPFLAYLRGKFQQLGYPC